MFDGHDVPRLIEMTFSFRSSASRSEALMIAPAMSLAKSDIAALIDSVKSPGRRYGQLFATSATISVKTSLAVPQISAAAEA
jgi:hypothetical protein